MYIHYIERSIDRNSIYMQSVKIADFLLHRPAVYVQLNISMINLRVYVDLHMTALPRVKLSIRVYAIDNLS